MKKPLKQLAVIGFILTLVIALFIISYDMKHEKNTVKEKPVQNLEESDVQKKLPLTIEVSPDDIKLETIAYRFWFNLMGAFKESGQISNAFFTRFHLLEGDEEEFVVAAIFQVQLGKGTKSTSWGGEQKENDVKGIVWKLKIKKAGERTYTLEGFEKSTDKLIGLPPIQDTDTYQEEVGIEEKSENYRYEITNDTLKVTYNNGNDWIEVPVKIEELFEGDYSGPKKYLIEGSYIISPDRTAFVLGGNHNLRLLFTKDQGKSWSEVVINDQLPPVRMRLLGFTSDLDGYVIATADRTMSSEGNFIIKTNDGGQSWKTVGSVSNIFSLVTDGCFINDQLGFVSFGSFNAQDQPPRPWLVRTIDGGSNWEEVAVPILDEYKGIFTVAEAPIFNGDHGTLIVNQGPNGDYLGGKVVAKYISEDEGKTWVFDSLVDPDNVLGE